MVKDCVRNWAEMAGSDDLEKQANAMLTTLFISRHDIPDDECLTEARRLRQIWDQADPSSWHTEATRYLSQQFGTPEDPTPPKRIKGACAQAMRLYSRLYHAQPLPGGGDVLGLFLDLGDSP
jgi:hypothetical protein